MNLSRTLHVWGCGTHGYVGVCVSGFVLNTAVCVYVCVFERGMQRARDEGGG